MSSLTGKPKEVLAKFKQELKDIYNEREINNIFHLLADQQFGLSKIELNNRDFQFNSSQLNFLQKSLNRLLKGEPVQHILGSVEFFGCEILVNPEVLIPRPETEELLDRIISNLSGKEERFLDIGTGSGCISVALKKQLSGVHVFAVDVSEKALELAQRSAEQNGVDVEFKKVDILTDDLADLPSFDMIVSNPPYIPEEDKKEMSRNVLDFEPQRALFVPDNDPLVFYRRITELAEKKLKAGGEVWFEIHELYGTEVVDILKKFGFGSVEIFQDLQGKDRIVSGVK